jgi:hypothetical protein
MSFTDAIKGIVGAASAVAFFWYFVRPWIPPLYARYSEWVKTTASGKKS